MPRTHSIHGRDHHRGEPSVLARMIVLDLPPWEQRDPTGQALIEADKLRQHLAGFTIHLAQVDRCTSRC